MGARRSLACVLLAALSCGPPEKSTRPAGPGPGSLVPIATPPGAPLAPEPQKAAVTSEGGSVTVDAGALTVSVPAGAVTGPTELTVLPIANTARGAVGPAFRLGPEGKVFEKPVTLTFRAPAHYPAGTSIADVGVEYQDALGFWRRVEPVTRDEGANTVSVHTSHFSDWALTWQGTTASAEGPIALVQTLADPWGIPFTATGTATLYFQQDTETDTYYTLTGTLTVPATIPWGTATCVPDQTTKTLPLNLAEVHKGSPPVFRWGIGVSWKLACSDGTTPDMPALFDTMYINPPLCPGDYAGGQIVSADRLAGRYWKDCGEDGTLEVDGTWDLQACVAGVDCSPAECRVGLTACTDGHQSCVETGFASNGSTCGTGATQVCSEGQCIDLNDPEVGVTVTPVSGLATTEAGGTATFQVVLQAQPTTTVTIALTSSSAEGTVSPASLSFGPGDWSVAKTVTVTGANDDLDDGDRPYTVVTASCVSADPRYGGLDPDDVQVTNVDDDTAGIVVSPTSGLQTTEAGGQATFTIVLTSQPTATVTVPLSTGSAEGTVSRTSVTFGPLDWDVAQAVTVAGANDDVDDGDQPYAVVTGVADSADPLYGGVDPPDVQVTNVDDDAAGIVVSPASGLQTTEAGGQATFTIAVSSRPTATVTIALSTSSAEGTVSPASVSFGPSDWSAKTVTVAGANDRVDDGDQAYAVVTGVAESADPGYAGRDPADVQVTNVDDDTAGIVVSPTSGLVTTEAGGQEAFTIVLASEPTNVVTIALSTSSAEGTVSPPSVTFGPADWDVAQVVTVTGADDDVDDGDQDYAVVTGAAASADPLYGGVDPDDVQVRNLDDDSAGFVVTPTAGLETTEGGGQASFTIVLTSQPTSDVTIPLSSSDGGEGTVSPDGVTFTFLNWSVPQTVTVTGVQDAAVDGPQAYVVQTGLAQTADVAYLDLNPDDVQVTNVDDDTAGIVVTPTSGLVTSEAGGQATFTIVLTSQPAAAVTIPLSTSPAEGTLSAASVSFGLLDWDVAQVVTVTGANDAVDDGDRAYTVLTGAAASDDPLYAGRDPADVQVTNLDDDSAAILVSPTTGLQTSEAGGQATFTIVLTAQPAAPVTVPLSTNSAEGMVSPASVTFGVLDWDVAQVVTVTGADDDVDDGDRAYAVVTGAAVSADPSYATRDPADVQMTNLDDDTAGIFVSPTAGLQTTEAGGQATFTIVLTSQPTATVTVPLSTSSAEGTVSPGSVAIDPLDWDVPHVVTVTGANDDVDDGNRAYSVVTGAAESADLGYAGQDPVDVQVTNLDDDAAVVVVSPTSGLVTTEAGGQATFTVVLASEPTDVVTIALSAGSAEGTVSATSLTFGPADWDAAQVVTVTGADDGVDDGDQPYAVLTGAAVSADPGYSGREVDDVQVTNLDDDSAGIVVSPTTGLATTETGGQAAFTIVLTSQPAVDVTIPLSSSDTGEGTVSPDSVTFTSLNWNVAQTVTVTGVQDAGVIDGPQPYLVLTGAAETADLAYLGLNADDVQVSNVDDDSIGIIVSPTSGLQTTEAGGQATFTVVMTSQPAATVTVPLSTSSAEGTVSPASLSFGPLDWDVAQVVTVTGANDGVDDGDRPYTVVTGVAESADPSYGGVVDPADVQVTNVDDDTATILVSPTTGLQTSEAGGQATFTIALSTQPTADVTVPLSTNSAEGTVSPASVTFGPLDWDVAQVVTVTGADDDVDDGDRAYAVVTGAAVSGDPSYGGRDPADVQVTNLDDDAAGIFVTPTGGLQTTEAGGQATFTVVLTSQPTATVTVPLSTSSAEGTVSPASVAIDPLDWDVPHVVTVTGANDDVDDGNRAYSVLTGVAESADPGYGGVIDPADVGVTNLDDDTAGIVVSPTSGLVTTEAGGQATFTIVLASAPTATVTVPLSTSSAEGTVSPASVVFGPLDWDVAQVVTVTGANDVVDDGDLGYAVVTGAAASADPLYGGMNPPDVLATNRDDDTAAIVVSPTSGLETSEGGVQATFTVVLASRPTADVTIPIRSGDPDQGTVSPDTVTFTFANWDVEQVVTVTGVQDTGAVDGSQAYLVLTDAAETADVAYLGLDADDVQVTNLDDDTAGIVVSPTAGLETTEGGGQAAFTVVLTSQPATTVTVPLSTSSAEGTVSPTSVVFGPADWDVVQIVTVTGANDDVDDGDQTYAVITGAAVSADAGYSGRDPNDVQVTNLDDDTAGILVSPTEGLVTSEAGQQASFTIVLTSQPTATVTISLTGDATEGSLSLESVTFTDADWNDVRPVTVTGLDDGVLDGSPTYFILTNTVTSDPMYVLLDPPDVQVRNDGS